MSIKISQYETKPAVDINEVHVSELRILIPEERRAKAQVRVLYKLFGRDAEGNKHFEPAQKVLAQALAVIEAAVASLIQQTGEVGEATVT